MEAMRDRLEDDLHGAWDGGVRCTQMYMWRGRGAAPARSHLPAKILGCFLDLKFDLNHNSSSFCFVLWGATSQTGVPRSCPPAPIPGDGMNREELAGPQGCSGHRVRPLPPWVPEACPGRRGSIAPSAETLVLAAAARLRLREGGPPPPTFNNHQADMFRL